MAGDAASGSTTRRVSSRIASQEKKPAPPAAKAASRKRAEAPKTAGDKPSSKSTSDKASAPKKAKMVDDGKSGLLAVGDALPTMTLQDEEGNDVQIDALKKVVIFTYPKANTGGCTSQACLYRDEYAEWQKLGFQVYGLSNDSATTLKNWKAKQSFPYPLLSDPQRNLVGALTGSKSSTTRSHFVIGGDGHVALSSVGVKPAESSPAALKFAQKL